ncbi:MAG: isochorismatase family protein [Xenococcaceae cyanobacterium MO_167.B27]|nr:isochorismatase family protein [Xenococcaceae cyanobacterium MO_167.B27]
MPIIHAPLVINPQRKKGILAHLTFGKIFTESTQKAEFTEGVYQVGDLVVEGRYAFDAFIGSNLNQILQQKDIENVFLCGFITDQCVKKTLKTALKKGLNAFIVTDCTATFWEFLQKNTEKKYRNRTCTSQDLLCSWS